MRIITIALALILSVAAQATDWGQQVTTAYINDCLFKPVNSSNAYVKPDRASVETTKAGTGQVYYATSSTFPFTAIGISLRINGTDTTYVFESQIAAIDGAGGNGNYSTVIKLYGAGDEASTKETWVNTTIDIETVAFTTILNLDYPVSSRLAPTITGRTANIGPNGEVYPDSIGTSRAVWNTPFGNLGGKAGSVGDSIKGLQPNRITTLLVSNLDTPVSSRLAPTVAARTLDVTATGEAGIDLSNTAGTIDAAEIGSAAFTNAKFGTGAITSTVLADGSITSAKFGSGAITSTVMAAGSITSSQAPNLDVAVSTRLAPTVATRTLDVTATGEAGIDFDNTAGTLGSADFSDGLWTSVKFADGFLTGAKIGAGAIGATQAPNLDVAVSTRLAPTVAARTLDVTTTGEAGLDLNNTAGTLDAAEFGSDFITGTKIAAGAITSSEAPNLDVAVSTRLAPGGTLAQVTTVDQLGGSTAGITGLNEMFDADGTTVTPEMLTVLASNGTTNDTRITSALASLAAITSTADSLRVMSEMLSYYTGSCNGCIKVYKPNDGTGYKNSYEVWVGGSKRLTVTFGHSNNPAVLDTTVTTKN